MARSHHSRNFVQKANFTHYPLKPRPPLSKDFIAPEHIAAVYFKIAYWALILTEIQALVDRNQVDRQDSKVNKCSLIVP